jgi:FkbM family methyltransferase
MPTKLLKKCLKAAITATGNCLLDSPPTRKAINSWYDTKSHRFVAWFFRFFNKCHPQRAFDWEYHFQGKTIVVPISPEFPRSWLVALSTRYHEPYLTEFFGAYTSSFERGVFFDVGANYGLHSYPFLANGYQCVLFEPQEECIRFIRGVSGRNGFHPRIEPCVLSNKHGEIPFFVSESTWFSSTSKESVQHFQETAREILVRARTLDAWITENGILPSLIKIDVEGHECAVIEGAAQLIRHSKPTLAIEVAKNNRRVLFGLLTAEGYRCYALSSENTYPVLSAEQAVQSTGSDFVFAVDPRAHQVMEEISRRAV